MLKGNQDTLDSFLLFSKVHKYRINLVYYV